MTDSLIVGRNTDHLPHAADISVDDEYVSNRHARIWRDQAGVWIEDLASTNGTWVDGLRIYGKTPLAAGSSLKVGHTTVTIPPEVFG